ncbi:hypothetical protein [Neorhizobium sp. DAR64860/K0K1]|uniref:hypothetical protein n=1 Tax=Neorhizobium sp. DAR64860/K0K1 TaxID=3421955 RepID=UPI003D27F795
MHRLEVRLPTIRSPEIREIAETLIQSVRTQADLYASLLFLEKLSANESGKSLFSEAVVSISNNFPTGIFTSTTTIDELVARIRSDEFAAETRNRMVVSFTSMFEAAVVAAMHHFNVQNPTGGAKYPDFDGGIYDTKIINMWLKLYRETLATLPSEQYFTPAVSTHAARYWTNLYKARNQIVHAGGIAKEDQASIDGRPWGATAIGQSIRTEHNKIDDIIQFFDNSFGHFLYDLGEYQSATP